MKNQRKAYLFGVSAVLVWSTVASVFKLSLEYLDPARLLLLSSIVSILALASILAVRGRLGLIFSCSKKEYARSLFLGIINPFLYYLVLFKAYDLLPAQVAQPVNYTWALMLAFLSIPLLKQKIGASDIVAGLVCYSGVVVISLKGDLSSFNVADPAGIGLALGSTVLWALFWISSAKDTRDPAAALLLNFLCGLPFIGLWCIVFSDLGTWPFPGIAGAVYVGLFEMGVTFLLWLHALKLSNNTARIGYLIFLSPLLSLVFIRFLVGEEIMISSIMGLGLILSGLIIQKIFTARES